MNSNLKKPILSFINSLLTLKGWQDISQPIIFQGEFSGQSKNLIDYFETPIFTIKSKITIEEYKSSSTAPLTKNQKIAFPELEKSGGIVVGKGKGNFPGGTTIPPTKVNIKRPK